MKLVLIILTVLALTVLTYSSPYKVQATSNPISPQQTNQGVATWNWVNGAKCYNIYYKRAEDSKWQHSVRCLPKTMWTYTINYLFVNTSYVYSVRAVDYSGREISQTPAKPLVTSPMPLK